MTVMFCEAVFEAAIETLTEVESSLITSIIYFSLEMSSLTVLLTT